jgi:uncharacterized membrane protein HdeD (DUF308 family)
MTWKQQILFLGVVAVCTSIVAAMCPPYVAGRIVVQFIGVFLAAAGGWIIRGRSE